MTGAPRANHARRTPGPQADVGARARAPRLLRDLVALGLYVGRVFVAGRLEWLCRRAPRDRVES